MSLLNLREVRVKRSRHNIVEKFLTVNVGKNHLKADDLGQI